MNAVKKLMRRDSGIALLTTMLLMILMSSLMVGFIILITSGQKLSGANNDYSRAFYGAEAGMEKITADIGTLFSTTYAPTAAQINAIAAAPPVIPGITYIQYNGASGYQVNYATDANGNPLATVTQVQSGAYQGMSALATQYTLQVTAHTLNDSEVKLQRTTQTVGIPVFQFGIFSSTDLSFFPGPSFSFGGRTATNGNLFLATSGGPLTLSDPVTAYLNVIRTNLANGYPTASSYNSTVDVFNGSGTRPLALTEGSLVGTIGSAVNPNWTTISLSPTDYAGNLRNGATGASQLNLGIVLLGGGTTQPIDLIRRPVVGESSTVTDLRYFAQASLQILLSDNPQDIMNLPCVDQGTQPVNLAQLATPVANWTGLGGNPALLYTKMNANNALGYNTPPVPLAASGAASGATSYSASGTTGNGYWLRTPTGSGYTTAAGLPIIQGFIKIEVQLDPASPCTSWKDVTLEVLGYGYAGRNINPNPVLNGGLTGTNLTATQYGTSEPLLTLPAQEVAAPTGTGTSATPCEDVHPNAIIRLERVRDNPSNYATTSSFTKCGVTNSATPASQKYPANPADYWPNRLFDTREGIARDSTPSGTFGGSISYSNMVTLGGVMGYIEIDAKNLAAYLAGTGVYAGGSGHLSYDSVNAPNDYTVYISDRRGNYTAGALTNAWPPLSPSGHETGEYGWDDLVNPASAYGCPNGTQDTGEDFDQLGTTGFYTYGGNPTYVMDANVVAVNSTWAQNQIGGSTGLSYGQYGFYGLTSTTGNLYGTATTNAIAANPNCTVTSPSTIWPWAQVIHANEARENPNPFFRRAVKIVDGNNLTGIGTCPGSVPCGLAIATENPAYVQGDFNANSAGGGWNDPNIAVSINADAVTLLSDNFNNVNSFEYPYVTSTTQRNATTTYYRAAVMAGKGVTFPQPTGACGSFGSCYADYGTDGGVHNFLRFLEDWANQTLYYRGSIISMYYNAQATGTYKDGLSNTVYDPPSRGYTFDTEFLTPSLLPPRTPLFRDVNTTGFTQLLLPTQ